MKAIEMTALLLFSLLLSGCFQVQLYGPIAASQVSVTALNDADEIASGTTWDDNFVIALRDQEKWDGYGPVVQLWFLGVYAPDTSGWDSDTYYLLTASGGEDTDVNRDLENDSVGTDVSGHWRAIISGAHAKKRGAKVSALTEAIFQYLSPDLSNMSNADLESRLNLISRRLVSDVNGDDVVDYFDALSWSRLFDGEKLLADVGLLNSLSSAILAGDQELRPLAEAFIESGADYDGEWVYRFSPVGGNSYTCAHCHAIVEPAKNGFARPGHPLGDATERNSYKDGQLSSLLDAANSCLDEWMNAPTWSNSSTDWLALESWLNTHNPGVQAEPVDIQIVAVPAELGGGDAAEGRAVFNASCAICHAEDGGGSRQAPAVAGFGLDAGYVANRVRLSGRTGSDVYSGLTGGIMPFWGANRLSNADLVDIVAFLELGQEDLATIFEGSVSGGGSGCGADHAKVGYTAELTTRQHRVSGTATIIDNCTIEITNFNYDGRGIVVQAYTGNDNNFLGDGAVPISENIVGSAFRNATVQFSLPTGLSLDDFNAISIWCVAVGTSFGDGIFGP